MVDPVTVQLARAALVSIGKSVIQTLAQDNLSPEQARVVLSGIQAQCMSVGQAWEAGEIAKVRAAVHEDNSEQLRASLRAMLAKLDEDEQGPEMITRITLPGRSDPIED